jgi:hypothetical protein
MDIFRLGDNKGQLLYIDRRSCSDYLQCTCAQLPARKFELRQPRGIQFFAKIINCLVSGSNQYYLFMKDVLIFQREVLPASKR